MYGRAEQCKIEQKMVEQGTDKMFRKGRICLGEEERTGGQREEGHN